MTRKIRRTADYDITLELKNPRFIMPPRDAQRNWLLNRAVNELAHDLQTIDGLAKRFVPGIDMVSIHERSHTILDDDDIMEDWQNPLMRAMAEVATAQHGDLLEIGFGRGVSAGYIQEYGVRSHTIVECNDSVIERFGNWRAAMPERDIRLIAGKWQDTIEQFGEYDAVFFHTYPLDEQEYLETAVNSVTFAEHFFATAAAVLRPGGVFVYMTNEIDSLSRGHQRALLHHFRSFSLQLQPLQLPSDVHDTWWADSMVVVGAYR
jgi:guanidinoacetate N-methyltransferase